MFASSLTSNVQRCVTHGIHLIRIHASVTMDNNVNEDHVQGSQFEQATGDIYGCVEVLRVERFNYLYINILIGTIEVLDRRLW